VLTKSRELKIAMRKLRIKADGEHLRNVTGTDEIPIYIADVEVKLVVSLNVVPGKYFFPLVLRK
jgi:hypothetical protein